MSLCNRWLHTRLPVHGSPWLQSTSGAREAGGGAVFFCSDKQKDISLMSISELHKLRVPSSETLLLCFFVLWECSCQYVSQRISDCLVLPIEICVLALVENFPTIKSL
jgi:hypothetical protein